MAFLVSFLFFSTACFWCRYQVMIRWPLPLLQTMLALPMTRQKFFYASGRKNSRGRVREREHFSSMTLVAGILLKEFSIMKQKKEKTHTFSISFWEYPDTGKLKPIMMMIFSSIHLKLHNYGSASKRGEGGGGKFYYHSIAGSFCNNHYHWLLIALQYRNKNHKNYQHSFEIYSDCCLRRHP